MKLEWHSGLESGIDEIDKQHKEIVEMYEALEGKNEREMVLAVVKFIAANMKEHFATEERYMELLDYPDIEEHKKEHKKMEERYKKTLLHMSKTSAELIAPKVKNEIIESLGDHLDDTDEKLMRFFREYSKKLEQTLG